MSTSAREVRLTAWPRDIQCAPGKRMGTGSARARTLAAEDGLDVGDGPSPRLGQLMRHPLGLSRLPRNRPLCYPPAATGAGREHVRAPIAQTASAQRRGQP
jgi:hypothetical protein